MVKEPPRKCSFCGQHGHNSRTCTNNNNNNIISKGPCLKLFGVNILDEAAASAADSMKKSQSMGNLARACDKGANDVVSSASSASDHESGYLSDGVIQNKRRKAAHERKRGTPWSEEEHRTFLAGLNDLGKGDWRGISMKYVPTRTPTQVASHAQKYFLRQQASNDKKKRRSSLFDMTYKPEEVEPQRYQVTSMMKSASQTLPTLAGGSQALPGNSSHEIMSRFPHLCLDNYMVPVRPATNAQSYHPIPYPYSVGVPANVHPLMMNYGIPSYLYNVPSSFPLNNNNNNMNASSFAPVMVAHPSGIPQPRSNPSSPSIAKRDGLELKIGQPQAKQGSGPSSPPSGAIRVT